MDIDFGTTEIVLIAVFAALVVGGIMLISVFAGGFLYVGGWIAAIAGVIAIIAVVGLNVDDNDGVGDPIPGNDAVTRTDLTRVEKILKDVENGKIKTTDELTQAGKDAGLKDSEIMALHSSLDRILKLQSPTTPAVAQPTPTPGNTGKDPKASSASKPKWLGSQCELASSIPSVSEGFKKGFTSPDSLAYPNMGPADPNRSSADFPDDVVNGVKPHVGYDVSFQNGDYFEDCFGDTDVPQYYWRVASNGYFWIPKSEETPEDIVCLASEKKGCLLIYVNHFGPTMKVNGVYADNGFTVAGNVWDMSTPDKVTAAAQVLVDHYVYRMIYGGDVNGRNDGTNCGVIEGCESIEWHVVIYGNSLLQQHWSGLWKP